MSTNNINTLNSPSMNGLGSLSLDELTTDRLKSDNIDGEYFTIETMEAYNVVVDNKLELSSTGFIIVGRDTVGEVIITDDQLRYLDGMDSNIQNNLMI